MKNIKNIGIDVGNFDTKTQSTVTPSGLEVSQTLPFGVTDYLLLDGVYYIPSDMRLPYEQDKTVNENCFVLSLIAISNEIIYCAEFAKAERERLAKLDNSKEKNIKSIQEEILDVQTVNIGIGLPPTHVSVLSEKLISYYKARFEDGIEYIYKGYTFRYKLGVIKCFPQDFAALITYHPKDRETSAISYPSYYGVDIGGWTVDVVTILNGKIATSKCDSKPLGVLAMYEKIIREIEVRYGTRLAITDIENLLKGEKTLIPPTIEKSIRDMVSNWYDDIIKTMKQFGIDLGMHPVVFLGGGSLLFKEYIKNDTRLAKYELMYNPKANAIAYATLLGPEK